MIFELTADRRSRRRQWAAVLRNGVSAATLASLLGLVPADAVFAADIAKTPVKAAPVADAPFFFINDNRITYAYAPDATEPGVTSKTAKQTAAFTHFDAWKYGTNLVNILYTKDDQRDPASPCGNFKAPTYGCAGAVEFYGLVRSTLGFNEIFDTRAFAIGPLRGVSFIFGGDGGVQNAFYASNKMDVVAGLQFAFELPYKGFFNVSPLYYQEWNNNAFSRPEFMPAGSTGLPDGIRHFDPTWGVEMSYYMDLGFLPTNLQYFAISGRAGFYGPKGNGAYAAFTSAAAKTTTEINSEPIRLTFDVSKLAWGEKYSHYLETWVAYRYWKNKFGLDDGNPANGVCFTARVNNGTCTEKTVYAGVTAKF